MEEYEPRDLYLELNDPTGGALYIVAALTSGVIFKTVLRNAPLPYTVIMLLIGGLFGWLNGHGVCEPKIPNDMTYCNNKVKYVCERFTDGCVWNGTIDLGVFGHSVDVWAGVDPHFILYAFLPALLYASAHRVDFHIFHHVLWQVLALAGPGVLLATVMTATFARYCFDAMGDYEWSWDVSLAFGAILSATDPVAVVALLHDLGAPRKLGIMIEGEALFNDGMALVLFLVFEKDMLQVEEETTFSKFLFFSQLAFGGALLGYILGRSMVFGLGYIREPILEIIVTVVFAYGTFIVSEQIHVSAVIATVCLGLVQATMGKSRVNNMEAMRSFWELLEFIANTLVFHIAGIITFQSLFSDAWVQSSFITPLDFLLVFFLWAALMLIRFVVNVILLPILNGSRYGTSWREVTVMTWSGLRGAVGLTMAMVLYNRSPMDYKGLLDADSGCERKGIILNDEFCTETGGYSRTAVEKLKAQILFHVAGIGMLTLLINGTTTGWLVNILGLAKQSSASKFTYDIWSAHVTDENEDELTKMRNHKFYRHADWKVVWQYLPVLNEEILEKRHAKLTSRRYRQILHGQISKLREKYRPERNPSMNLDVAQFPVRWRHFGSDELKRDFIRTHWELVIEARKRALDLVQAHYWDQFHAGFVSGEAVSLAVQAKNLALDDVTEYHEPPENDLVLDKCKIDDWQYLEPHMLLGRLQRKFNRFMKSFMNKVPMVEQCSRSHMYARLHFILDTVHCFIQGHDEVIHILGVQEKVALDHLYAAAQARADEIGLSSDTLQDLRIAEEEAGEENVAELGKAEAEKLYEEVTRGKAVEHKELLKQEKEGIMFKLKDILAEKNDIEFADAEKMLRSSLGASLIVKHHAFISSEFESLRHKKDDLGESRSSFLSRKESAEKFVSRHSLHKKSLKRLGSENLYKVKKGMEKKKAETAKVMEIFEGKVNKRKKTSESRELKRAFSESGIGAVDVKLTEWNLSLKAEQRSLRRSEGMTPEEKAKCFKIMRMRSVDAESFLHHDQHPVLLGLAKAELEAAREKANALFSDYMGTNLATLKTISTQHVIRHLIKDLENNVHRIYHEGQIDHAELELMNAAVHECDMKLKFRPPIAKAPAKEEVLRAVPFMNELKENYPDEFHSVAQRMTEEHFHHGFALLKQGNKSNGCYLIAAGCVNVYHLTETEANEAKQIIREVGDEHKHLRSKKKRRRKRSSIDIGTVRRQVGGKISQNHESKDVEEGVHKAKSSTFESLERNIKSVTRDRSSQKLRLTSSELEDRYGRLVDQLGPGQIVGALSTITGKPRYASAVACTHCICYYISTAEISKLFLHLSGKRHSIASHHSSFSHYSTQHLKRNGSSALHNSLGRKFSSVFSRLRRLLPFTQRNNPDSDNYMVDVVEYSANVEPEPVKIAIKSQSSDVKNLANADFRTDMLNTLKKKENEKNVKERNEDEALDNVVPNVNKTSSNFDSKSTTDLDSTSIGKEVEKDEIVEVVEIKKKARLDQSKRMMKMGNERFSEINEKPNEENSKSKSVRNPRPSTNKCRHWEEEPTKLEKLHEERLQVEQAFCRDAAVLAVRILSHIRQHFPGQSCDRLRATLGQATLVCPEPNITYVVSDRFLLLTGKLVEVEGEKHVEEDLGFYGMLSSVRLYNPDGISNWLKSGWHCKFEQDSAGQFPRLLLLGKEEKNIRERTNMKDIGESLREGDGLRNRKLRRRSITENVKKPSVENIIALRKASKKLLKTINH
eukprot:g2081.t1